MGKSVFIECSSLLSITVPKKVIEIRDDFCRGCSNLEHLSISDKVQVIGQNAFDGCKKLRIVRLPNALMRIMYRAFSNCESIESIIIPKSVLGIEGKAFCDCSKLKRIVFKNPNTLYDVSAFTDCVSLVLKKSYKIGKFKNLKKKTNVEVEKCPITCETMTNNSVVVLLKCGHIFTESAFKEWEKQGNFCPCCRAVF